MDNRNAKDVLEDLSWWGYLVVNLENGRCLYPLMNRALLTFVILYGFPYIIRYFKGVTY